jgi:hypothetical protein
MYEETEETERDEYLCPECSEMRDVEEMCNENGACDWCNSAKCPSCNSSAVGYSNGTYECFECDNEWRY